VSEPQAHTELLRARAALDDALCALCAVQDAALPVSAAEERIAGALEHAYRALGASSDAELFGRSVQAAGDDTSAALVLLQDVAQRDAAQADSGWQDCTRASAQALSALRASRYVAGAVPFALPRLDAPAPSASVGLPRTLDPPRPLLRPTLPLPSREPAPEPLPSVPSELPPPAPIDPAALDALMARTAAAAAEADATADDAPRDEGDGERKPAPKAPPPLPDALLDALRFGEPQREDAVLFDRARVALEELGMLALMRRPDDEDPWTSNRECERRILCRLDAVIAADLVRLPRLIRLLEERPLPDAELTLALVFVLGSLRGDDTRDEIARLLRVIALGDGDMFVAMADALSLSQHPGVPALLAGWLGDARPERRALATEVLGRKRLLDADAVARACADDDLAVQRAAARALCKYDGALPSADGHRLLHHDDPEVATYALRAIALRGDARALERARELVEADRAAHADAAYVVALCGGADEGRLLAAHPCRAVFAAFGWYGRIDSAPLLLAALEDGDDDAKVEAATALHRITGAGLTDGAPMPEYADDPQAAPFLDAYREPTTPAELSSKPDVWRAYLERYARAAKPERRYRYGRPFSAAHDQWELVQPRAVRGERERAYLELRARFGVHAPLDTQAFVLAQHAQLQEIGAQAARAAALRHPWQSRLVR
jgi:hypothetical protein